MHPINNLGQYLETIINITNQKYLKEKLCLVTKIPTNINLVQTNNKKIINANFKENFNCDYIGVYQGQYFEFEAKETYQDYFDFKGLRKNQQTKLSYVCYFKGISFVIIYFGKYEEFFIIDFLKIKEYANNIKKRISYKWFEENAYKLYLTYELKLDYLKFLNCLVS
ncbi:Holliday junction resolvase RecU [Mesoplasma syrphidae]|uniref:Holliday junction resolvase RecU n=1 Tax=Mesoplasma syrphidae TaxID=225999 RepID=A0A2K9BRN2_9MOLU|nr:Holliday junction resolvase RecU [Mesoplasma syrphidae]AUF83662.1 Holliday junction resolvase RecU [Mesoplasma syrphidae]